MERVNENSSLYIMLSICVAIVACVAVGWYLLDTNADEQAEQSVETAIPEPAPPSAAGSTSPPDTVEPGADAQISDIDANLRKARVAAAADILIEPTEQSALYYYGRVLEADPNHPVAAAELNSVLSQLAVSVQDHLAAEEYEEAYGIAQLVSIVRPDHPLVEEVQHRLNKRAGEILEQAMQLAREGDHEAATSAVNLAEALPGQNTDYFAAVRDTIAELQASQQRAEEERIAQIENEQRDFMDATEAWMRKTRAAINAGRLITPPGGSARDFFAERSLADEYQDEVRGDLIAAIVDTIDKQIGNGRLSEAEVLVDAAADLGAEPGVTARLRESIEETHIEIESGKLLAVNELVRINTVAARYPRLAANRGVSGWVEVVFTVTPSGETADIEISKAEPEKVFDKAVIDAVSQWTFEPREYRGQTISQRTIARLVFQLE